MSNYCRDAKQIADLILDDPLNTGEKLVICSTLYNESENSFSFYIQQNKFEGAKFKVSIQIEEV